MLAAVDPHWLNKLRFHLADFRATAFPARGLPCSVKLRPESGRFDREHSPHAYQIIESTVRPILTSRHWLLDHSTGPEILTFAGRALAELTLCETTVTTMARIVGARVQGARLGDPCEAALTALVRGFDEHGEYFERTVWRGAPKEEASPADIVAGLAAQGIGVLATPPHPSHTIRAPASVNR